MTNAPAYSEYYGTATDAALNNGIDPSIFASLINVESGWNPNAVSSAGAIGLTQVLPSTASDVDPNANLYNPVDSINTGASYLGSLLKQYNGNYQQALAAYNAGPGNVNNPDANPAAYQAGMQYADKVLSGAGVSSDTAAGSAPTSSSSSSSTASSGAGSSFMDKVNKVLQYDFLTGEEDQTTNPDGSKVTQGQTIAKTLKNSLGLTPQVALAIGIGALCVILIAIAAFRLSGETLENVSA